MTSSPFEPEVTRYEAPRAPTLLALIELSSVIDSLLQKAEESKFPNPGLPPGGCSFCDRQTSSAGFISSYSLMWSHCSSCEKVAKLMSAAIEEASAQASSIKGTFAVHRRSGDIDVGIWQCAGLTPVAFRRDDILVNLTTGVHIKMCNLNSLEDAHAKAGARQDLPESKSASASKEKAQAACHANN